MTKVLHLGPKLQLPAGEAQTQTLVVYGGKGMGKTNFGAVLAEELAGAVLRFSWIDPVGVAWGLKHSADGRGPGLEVLILGGIHGDIPINPDAGAVVADLVVDEPDVSVIIDISRHADGRMWTGGEKIRFVRDYFTRLYQRQGEKRRPIMQIVDEAGRFVPQDLPRGAIDIMECVGAIEQTVELGRNVGIGVTLITQRSARMRKSVSELAEMMVGFRTVGPRSIDAIIDWFGEHVPKDRQKALIERLRELPRGTALVVAPGWLGTEGEFEIRARTTFDSSATPVAGKERKPAGKGATVDLNHYQERMRVVISEAKTNDPKELKKMNADLQRRLEEAERSIAQLEQAKEVTSTRVERVVEEIQVPVFSDGEVDALAGIVKNLATISRDVATVAKSIEQAVSRAEHDVVGVRKKLQAAAAAPRPERQPRMARPARAPFAPRDVESITDGSLTGPEQRVLDAIRWFHEVGIAAPGKTQVGFIAGYRVGKKVGGTYGNILGALKNDGGKYERPPLIDYPTAGAVSLTDEGWARAQDPGIDRSNEGLQAAVMDKLDGPERRVLGNLIELYPDAIAKTELGERSGYTVGDKIGGTYGNILGRLRSLGLIDYPGTGMAVALPILFPEEHAAAA